jgi:hypothetical protein
MKDRKVHFIQSGLVTPLCRETRRCAKSDDRECVTCLRCLFFLGRYFPTNTDAVRRKELLERSEKLND